MSRRLGLVPGLALAMLATIGAYRSWRDARGDALLALHRELAEEGASASSSRMAVLLRAIDQGGVTSEARTTLAVERVAAASAMATSDEVPGRTTADAADEGRKALSDVREALLAFPGNARAWLAGYRVVETSSILGLDVLGETGGRAETPAHSTRFVIFDPASIGDLNEGLRDPSRLSAAFIAGASRNDPHGGWLQHQIGSAMLAAGHAEDAFDYLARAAHELSADPARIANEMLDGGYAPQDVLEAMPRRFDAQIRVGGLLLGRKLDALAETAFREASRLDPGAHESWTALALLAGGRGRHQDALDLARRALPLIPEHESAVLSRVLSCAAQASRALDDLPSAIAYGSRAIEADPRRISLYPFMGSALSDSGDDAGAIRHWQTLIDDHPSDPYVIANLARLHRLIGRSYERLGMRDRAVEHYLDALRASPRDAESRAALGRLTGR